MLWYWSPNIDVKKQMNLDIVIWYSSMLIVSKEQCLDFWNVHYFVMLLYTLPEKILIHLRLTYFNLSNLLCWTSIQSTALWYFWIGSWLLLMLFDTRRRLKESILFILDTIIVADLSENHVNHDLAFSFRSPPFLCCKFGAPQKTSFFPTWFFFF